MANLSSIASFPVEISCKTMSISLCISRAHFFHYSRITFLSRVKLAFSHILSLLFHHLPHHHPPQGLPSLFHYSTASTITNTK